MNNRFLIICAMIFISVKSFAYEPDLGINKVENYALKNITETVGHSNVGIKFKNSLKHLNINEITCENIDVDFERKKFQITAIDSVSKKHLINGVFFELVELPIFNKMLKSGHIITEEDIAYKSFPENILEHSDFVENKEMVVGKAAKTKISPFTPIRNKDVKNPILINKNSHIQIIFIKSNLVIKASGIALSEGSLYEVIKVKNVDSGKIIKGRVKDEQTVIVGNDE